MVEPTIATLRAIAEELRVNRGILEDLVLIRLISRPAEEPEDKRVLRGINEAFPRAPDPRPGRPAVLELLDRIAKRR